MEIAAEQMPDLILTDLMMPEMDGYELCRRVRESEVLKSGRTLIWRSLSMRKS